MNRFIIEELEQAYGIKKFAARIAVGEIHGAEIVGRRWASGLNGAGSTKWEKRILPLIPFAAVEWSGRAYTAMRARSRWVGAAQAGWRRAPLRRHRPETGEPTRSARQRSNLFV
jgi:hypothetical protein